jgi:hypothetical protein
MEMWLRGTDGELLATFTGGKLYVPPGVDRDIVAFALFKVLNEAMNPTQGVSVTWGSRYSVRGN